MKPNTVKAILHIWGLAVIITLSFYLCDTKTAATYVLCALPVNYWICNMIFRFIYSTKNKDKHDG